MSFPSTTSDRSLSLLLRQSLKDVLTEVSSDVTPSFNAPSLSSTTVSPATENGPSFQVSSMMGLFPPTLSPSASMSLPTLSPSTSMSLPTARPQSVRPSALLGMSSQDLLLAAAAEKRFVNEQNAAAAAAALRQHALRQSFQRQSQKSSLLGLFQQGFAGTSSFGLGSKPQPIQHGDALQKLGTDLREKSSPYVDVADAPDPDPNDTRVKKTRGGVTEPFPERLHRLLKEIEDDGNGDVISFLPHGRAFVIHKPEKFVSEIMPLYFKMSQLQSFQRQLNLYGFKRILHGRDAGAYYHELFLQGRPNMCLLMRRVGLPKGDDRRKMRAKAVGVQVDPDFYSMKPVAARK